MRVIVPMVIERSGQNGVVEQGQQLFLIKQCGNKTIGS
jgi:hypothetical protein